MKVEAKPPLLENQRLFLAEYSDEGEKRILTIGPRNANNVTDLVNGWWCKSIRMSLEYVALLKMRVTVVSWVFEAKDRRTACSFQPDRSRQCRHVLFQQR